MKRYKILAASVVLAVIAGCDDYPTALRDLTALNSEIGDMMTKVVDEATAKEFQTFETSVALRFQKVMDKKVKYITMLTEKKERDNFQKLEAAVLACVEEDRYPVTDDFKGLELGDAHHLFTREYIALRKSLRRQVARIKNVVEDLKEKKRLELIQQGEANPVVEPETLWPALVDLSKIVPDPKR